MYDGDTPMHMASYRANTAAMELLLKSGANINTPNQDGNTPMYSLLQLDKIDYSDKLDAMKYLLSKGAEVNVLNNEGWLPLIWAVEEDHPEAVAVLIDNGADINAKNKDGKTVINIAQDKGNEELVELLQAKINEKSVTENQDKEDVIVNAVTDIIYDNELLNYPGLLKEPLKVFSLNQILDLSEHLNQALITEAITNNDSCLVLGALMSLSGEDSYG